MAELTEQHKEAIVLLLARNKGPAEVAVTMRDEFGLELIVQQIVKYDPTRAAYEAGDKWLPIFEEARRAYLEDVAKVAIGNQAFRLNELLDLYQAAKKQKNYKLAAELLEQAAKETGGSFTNARDVTINDNRKPLAALTPEERRELLLGKLDDAIAARRANEAGDTLQ